MLNQIVLVGRLVQGPLVIETESGKKAKISIRVPRNYKNAEGIYENDTFECILWGSLEDNIKEIMQPESVVGIRGRLQNFEELGKMKNIIIADKVSLLSSKGDDSSDECS